MSNEVKYKSIKKPNILLFHDIIKIKNFDSNNMKWYVLFNDMFVYYKCYSLIEVTILKKLMFLKQVDKKSVIFVNIGISYVIFLSFNQMCIIPYW